MRHVTCACARTCAHAVHTRYCATRVTRARTHACTVHPCTCRRQGTHDTHASHASQHDTHASHHDTHASHAGDIADRTPGADKDAILHAVGADRRVGHSCLKAGFGFGGPCFPRDNRALGAYARRRGVEPTICDATDDYNKRHAAAMADMLLAQDLER